MKNLKRNVAIAGAAAIMSAAGVAGAVTAHASAPTPSSSVDQTTTDTAEVAETNDGPDQGPDANPNEAGHQDANESGETEAADGAEGTETEGADDGPNQGPDADKNEAGHQDANQNEAGETK